MANEYMKSRIDLSPSNPLYQWVNEVALMQAFVICDVRVSYQSTVLKTAQDEEGWQDIRQMLNTARATKRISVTVPWWV